MRKPYSLSSTKRSVLRRVRHLDWWSEQFAGLTLAEVTADRISKARDLLATETFVRGKPHKDRKTGEILAPQEYTRTAQQ
jgi:hypothetical protein